MNPTRYRQIVETESNERLNNIERETISKDQKHSLYVAKRMYQKKLSREVAVEGRACMQKIVGKGRDTHTTGLASSLSEDKSITEGRSGGSGEFTPYVTDQKVGEQDSTCSLVSQEDVVKNMDTVTGKGNDLSVDDRTQKVTVVEIQDVNITTNKALSKDERVDIPEDCYFADLSPLNIDVEVKREVAEENVREGASLKRFTPDEDKYLEHKYGSSNWNQILKDKEYMFSPSRTRESLRLRAKTLRLLKIKQNKTNKC